MSVVEVLPFLLGCRRLRVASEGGGGRVVLPRMMRRHLRCYAARRSCVKCAGAEAVSSGGSSVDDMEVLAAWLETACPTK